MADDQPIADDQPMADDQPIPLPFDLIERICFYVGGFEVIKCRLVSTQWRSFVDNLPSDFWKTVCALEFPISAKNQPSGWETFVEWNEEYRRRACSSKLSKHPLRQLFKCSFCFQPLIRKRAIRPYHRDDRALICLNCASQGGCLVSRTKCLQRSFRFFSKSDFEKLYKTKFFAEQKMGCGLRSGEYCFVWDLTNFCDSTKLNKKRKRPT